jgi:GNAT superfamily N-acetyltransferase
MAASEIRFRPATSEDCAMILHQRRSMFEDMKEGSAEDLDRMIDATTPWLARALADGSYRGWLAEDPNGKVMGGGGMLISSWPAGPRDPITQRAHILNVYIEREVRRQGLAKQLMLLMIQWLREQGFSSVALHASEEGRPLHEKLYFVPTNEMRLRLK